MSYGQSSRQLTKQEVAEVVLAVSFSKIFASVACCIRVDAINVQQRAGEASMDCSGLKMVYQKQTGKVL